MKVTADMKIKDVLKFNEQMIEAFAWLAPEFERLRNPRFRRLMAGRGSSSRSSSGWSCLAWRSVSSISAT